jgi:hypothetical protein
MLSSPVYAESRPRQPIPHARLSSISFRRSQRSNVQTFQRFNDPRPNAIQSPSKACHTRPLPSRQHRAPLSPLSATLMDHPASVANKRLTAYLTPLDATLTKKRGEGCTLSFTPFHQIPAAPVFSFTYKLPIFYPFVLTFIHVMGGCTPLPGSFQSGRCDVQRLRPLDVPSLAASQAASYTLEHPDETMRTLP